jgi:hypothetical protein
MKALQPTVPVGIVGCHAALNLVPANVMCACVDSCEQHNAAASGNGQSVNGPKWEWRQKQFVRESAVCAPAALSITLITADNLDVSIRVELRKNGPTSSLTSGTVALLGPLDGCCDAAYTTTRYRFDQGWLLLRRVFGVAGALQTARRAHTAPDTPKSSVQADTARAIPSLSHQNPAIAHGVLYPARIPDAEGVAHT